MEIHLAHTQGFCAGVSRAIEIVDIVFKKYGAPLYVKHQIVHNTSVIKNFENKGVVFIESLTEVPKTELIIFSAHGVSVNIYKQAKKSKLKYIDATCPLVMKVHHKAERFSKDSINTILIGHKGHQEIIGTSGYIKPELLHIVENEEDVEKLVINKKSQIGYLTQTTLSVSDTAHIIQKLKQKFPNIIAPEKDDICFATQNRQDAVMELTEFCDLIIICGSPNSSNSNRLKETASNQGIKAFIIDTVEELKKEWFENVDKVGISSGASVPSYILNSVVEKIQELYPESKIFQSESIEKNIVFKIPEID